MGISDLQILRERLEKAYEVYLNYGNFLFFIVSGKGRGKRPTFSIMKEILVEEYGIDEQRVFCDEHSTNTIECLSNSEELFTNLTANTYDVQYCVRIISSEYHIPRVKLLCKYKLFSDSIVIFHSSKTASDLDEKLEKESEIILSMANTFSDNTER